MELYAAGERPSGPVTCVALRESVNVQPAQPHVAARAALADPILPR